MSSMLEYLGTHTQSWYWRQYGYSKISENCGWRRGRDEACLDLALGSRAQYHLEMVGYLCPVQSAIQHETTTNDTHPSQALRALTTPC
jgi:hypothetical protein